MPKRHLNRVNGRPLHGPTLVSFPAPNREVIPGIWDFDLQDAVILLQRIGLDIIHSPTLH